jgi:hypothetical protein
MGQHPACDASIAALALSREPFPHAWPIEAAGPPRLAAAGTHRGRRWRHGELEAAGEPFGRCLHRTGSQWLRRRWAVGAVVQPPAQRPTSGRERTRGWCRRALARQNCGRTSANRTASGRAGRVRGGGRSAGRSRKQCRGRFMGEQKQQEDMGSIERPCYGRYAGGAMQRAGRPPSRAFSRATGDDGSRYRARRQARPVCSLLHCTATPAPPRAQKQRQSSLSTPPRPPARTFTLASAAHRRHPTRAHCTAACCPASPAIPDPGTLASSDGAQSSASAGRAGRWLAPGGVSCLTFISRPSPPRRPSVLCCAALLAVPVWSRRGSRFHSLA